MTDEAPPKKPRRFFPRPDDPEVVRVDEDPPAPPTQRLPIIPPAPRVPSNTEPFRLVDGRKPSYVEFSAQLTGFQAQLAGFQGRQDKFALQLDHHGSILNQRFDIFHQELALTRHDVSELLALVTTNHGPRIEKVEATVGQKVAKGGSVLGILVLALPLLADALPKYRHWIDAIVGVLQ